MTGEKGRVVGTEINKYIAYLCKDGLNNYIKNNIEKENSMAHIEVINESYEDYLKRQADNSFDVVYFDPMFKKPNKKSTSINSFRAFADHRGVTKEILEEALRVCRRRVVIKERYDINDFDKLGIEKCYGSSRHGSIVYGIIEK